MSLATPSEILGIVPARGGSKSVPGKNVKLLAGEPLIGYTIRTASSSHYITRLVVSTDDDEIATVSRQSGGEVPFVRPQELAEDDTPDLPVFQHCLQWLDDHEGYRPQIVVHLRPTSPLRRAEHIDRGVEMLLARPDATCVRSVSPAPQHPLKMWRIDEGYLSPFVPESVYDVSEPYNLPRQILPAAYIQNGAIDVIRASVIQRENSMSGNLMLGMIMDEEDSVNIDSEIDFLLAEHLMQIRKDQPAARSVN